MNAASPRRYVLKVLRYHVDECTNDTGDRPCPNRTCRYAIAHDPVIGAVESCALDVAGRGGETMEEIGTLMGVTRQAIEQGLVSALRKLRRKLDAKSTRNPEPVVAARSVRFCPWCAGVVPCGEVRSDGRPAKRRTFCTKACAAKYRDTATKLAHVAPEKRRVYLNKAVARMALTDRDEQ